MGSLVTSALTTAHASIPAFIAPQRLAQEGGEPTFAEAMVKHRVTHFEEII
jgi:hypothetical protein